MSSLHSNRFHRFQEIIDCDFLNEICCCRNSLVIVTLFLFSSNKCANMSINKNTVWSWLLIQLNIYFWSSCIFKTSVSLIKKKRWKKDDYVDQSQRFSPLDCNTFFNCSSKNRWLGIGPHYRFALTVFRVGWIQSFCFEVACFTSHFDRCLINIVLQKLFAFEFLFDSPNCAHKLVSCASSGTFLCEKPKNVGESYFGYENTILNLSVRKQFGNRSAHCSIVSVILLLA